MISAIVTPLVNALYVSESRSLQVTKRYEKDHWIYFGFPQIATSLKAREEYWAASQLAGRSASPSDTLRRDSRDPSGLSEAGS